MRGARRVPSTTLRRPQPPTPCKPPKATQNNTKHDGSTRECLRSDPASCFPEDSEYRAVTHNGLDALVEGFIAAFQAFVALPAAAATADHPAYLWVFKVGGHDLVDGFYRAVDMFEAYTIAQFEAVTQLHQAMLAVTAVLLAAYMLLLHRPYAALLKDESKAIAGMLSQLPAEASAEDAVRTQALGLPPRGAGGGASSAAFGGAGGATMMMMGGGGGLPMLPVPGGGYGGGGGGGFPMGGGFGGGGGATPRGAMMGGPPGGGFAGGWGAGGGGGGGGAGGYF